MTNDLEAARNVLEKAWARANEDSRRLEAIPGIGFITAAATVATVPDPHVFRSGRDFAAWLGIVPRQDSTAGKSKLGPISKQGDRYLRRLCVVGAMAVLRRARTHPEKNPWLTQLLARKPPKVAAVALANKTAHYPRASDRRTQDCGGDDGVMRIGRAEDRDNPSESTRGKSA